MVTPTERIECDALVIGGCTAALTAAEARKSVDRVVVAPGGDARRAAWQPERGGGEGAVAPRHVGGEMAFLFVNGLVLDGLGGAVERGGVLVEGERITAVGRGLENRPDRETQVIDLAERTILPGLVDTHVHIAGGDYSPGYLEENIALAALRTAEVVHRTLMAGITTVRTGGSRDFLDIDIRNAIDAGLIPGPRIVASGRGLTTTCGFFHSRRAAGGVAMVTLEDTGVHRLARHREQVSMIDRD